jgi:predicted RNA binding protein YcfA (HicA-like mRNA interferase family)
MTKVPGLRYEKVIKALKRYGWVVVHQKGSHIRLQKHMQDEVLKLTIPATVQ